MVRKKLKWFAIGVGSKNLQGKWLEVFFPRELINPKEELVSKAIKLSGFKGGNASLPVPQEVMKDLEGILNNASYLRNVKSPMVMVMMESDSQPQDVPEAYLKLHLLSLRLKKPNELNLKGIFSILPTVAWTSIGPKDPSELNQLIFNNRLTNDHIKIFSIDKFPTLTDYVIPDGVRIADSHRIRLGAYIGEGTTVMHEGFINFNSGTLGKSMIEGRISQGVVVDEGSDLGGSASTMGTLSGGNETLISLGKDCLLGANSGLGIPLGDRCIVEAGLYITAGTKIELTDSSNKSQVVKASELSYKNDLLFIRNSLTGKVQCKQNTKRVNLNEELHSNN